MIRRKWNWPCKSNTVQHVFMCKGAPLITEGMEGNCHVLVTESKTQSHFPVPTLSQFLAEHNLEQLGWREGAQTEEQLRGISGELKDLILLKYEVVLYILRKLWRQFWLSSVLFRWSFSLHKTKIGQFSKLPNQEFQFKYTVVEQLIFEMKIFFP